MMLQLGAPQTAETCFVGGRLPRLNYFCRVEGAYGALPRAMHMHKDCAELVLICGGRGTHTIGDGVYQTKAGDLLFYDANVPHDERPEAGDALQYYCLAITGLRLRGRPENAIVGTGYAPILSAGEGAARLQALCALLDGEIDRGRMLSGEICRFYMLAILLEAVELVEAHGTVCAPPPDTLARQIKAYIDNHYCDPLTLSAISEALGVSSFHLSRLLKEKTGFSPMQYQINRRMGEAQTLLITTELSITQIAERVGYDNPNYFNLLFKKNVRLTPGQYRRIVRGIA